MNHTENELFLARSAIELYAKSRGRDFLAVDEINFILENSPEFLQIILNECGADIGVFRKAISLKNKINIVDLTSSVRLYSYIFIGLLGVEIIGEKSD